MITHALVACNLHFCYNHAARHGWKFVRIPPHQRHAAEDGDGNTILFVTDVKQLADLPPEVTIYLGYSWVFAYGGNPREAVEAHIARGGKAIPFD